MSASAFDWDQFRKKDASTKTEKFDWDSYRKEGTKKGKEDIGRHAMQSIIGGAKGAAYVTPAGPPLALAEIAYPGARQNTINELLESERDEEAFSKIFGTKVEDPKLNPEALQEGAKNADQFLFGGEGLVGGAASAPYRAFGIDTNPQTEGEERTRFVSELLTGLMKSGISLKDAQALAYDLTTTVPKQKWRAILDTINPSRRATQTQENVLGKNVPNTIYKPSEELIGELQEKNIQHPTEPLSLEFPGAAQQQSPSLLNRVSVEVPPSAHNLPNSVQDIVFDVGSVVSPRVFRNRAQGGLALKEITREAANTEREAVSELYRRAEEGYQGISDIYPQLVSNLQDRLRNLQRTVRPNTGERAVMAEIESLLDILGNAEGGYRGMPVDALIKTSDSITAMAKYDMPFNGPKDILKGVSRDLNNAAREAIHRQGGDTSLINAADREFGRWSQRFGNDEIAPFLERGDLNPEEIYDKAINFKNPKNHYALTQVFEDNPAAQQFIDMTQRDLVEEALQPFSKDLSKIGSKEYEKVISNLEPILGENRVDLVDQRMRSIKNRKAKQFTKEQEKRLAERIGSYTQDLNHASKYLDKPPEMIGDLLNSRTGIKQLRQDVTSKKGKVILNRLEKNKLKQILTGGKIKKSPTGSSVIEALNNQRNFEIVEEIMGEREANQFYEIAEKIGNAQITKDRVVKAAKIYGVAKALQLFLPIIP